MAYMSPYAIFLEIQTADGTLIVHLICVLHLKFRGALCLSVTVKIFPPIISISNKKVLNFGHYYKKIKLLLNHLILVFQTYPSFNSKIFNEGS